MKINWNQLTNDSQTIREQIQDKLSRNTQTGLQKFNEFASQNVYLASGYAGDSSAKRDAEKKSQYWLSLIFHFELFQAGS